MAHTKHDGFTLIELILVIIILGILSSFAVSKFIDLKREANIALLKATKGVLESSFDMFAMKTQMPSAKLVSCSRGQSALHCILLNGERIAFTQKDHHPVLNPWPLATAESIKQLLAIADIDINIDSSPEGPYDHTLNYADGIYDGANSNDFWIFPKMSGDWSDIEGFKCKIHYLPENNPLNKAGKSIFTLETSGC